MAGVCLPQRVYSNPSIHLQLFLDASCLGPTLCLHECLERIASNRAGFNELGDGEEVARGAVAESAARFSIIWGGAETFAEGNWLGVMKHRTLTIAAGIVAGVAAAKLIGLRRHVNLRDKVVFVSGGSRGLGLVLAREFAHRGAKVAISARDREELDRAAKQLQAITDDVLTIAADMTVREQAAAAIERTIQQFGSIDVLVNNAGTISVGPIETMTIDDYQDSLNTHFWVPYFAISAVLPSMKQRKSGHIVNISSIGGKISVPHLVPYSVGKFALTGYSEGLRSELLKDNVYVTTVCPGLMRTGSPRNAFFKGNHKAEYAWFSVSGSLPLISMSAQRAARQIVDACIRGDAEIVLSLPAKAAAKLHALFPAVTVDLLGLINRLLPGPGGAGTERRTGRQSFSNISPSWVTTLDEQAARQNNEVA